MPEGSDQALAPDRSRLFSQVIGASTRRSSATPFAIPRTISIVPSVTMKGTTRRRVMSSPLTSPQAAAAATPASSATAGDAPSFSSTAITTVVSEMTEPTERSMPPATITAVMPIAAMQTIAVWRAISSRLPGSMNCDAGERGEDQRHQHEAEQRAGAVEQRPRGHDARAAPPVIVATIRSDSFSSATGRAGWSRPRNITATRSQTPSSSGR